MNILIIEDDPVFAEKLEHYIPSGCSAIVTTVGDAQSAINYLKNKKVDLMFVDYHLPDSTGIDTIIEIRATAKKASIVMMSAAFSIEKVALCINNGANFLLDKLRWDQSTIAQLITANELRSGNKWWFVNALKKGLHQQLSQEILMTGIIEDDAIFALNLELILQRSNSKFVCQVFDSKENFDNANPQTRFDLLFIDYQLGVETAEAIVKQVKAANPDTTIVMVTNQHKIDVAIDLKNIGVDFYIQKANYWQADLVEIVDQWQGQKTSV